MHLNTFFLYSQERNCCASQIIVPVWKSELFLERIWGFAWRTSTKNHIWITIGYKLSDFVYEFFFPAARLFFRLQRIDGNGQKKIYKNHRPTIVQFTLTLCWNMLAKFDQFEKWWRTQWEITLHVPPFNSSFWLWKMAIYSVISCAVQDAAFFYTLQPPLHAIETRSKCILWQNSMNHTNCTPVKPTKGQRI